MIQTFPVMNIQNCSADRSRSRHRPEVIQIFPEKKFQNFPAELVTESAMSRAGSDTDFPSVEHSEFFGRPVTESVTARAGSDTNFPRAKHSEFSGRPVMELAMSRAGSDINFHRDEHSEFFGRPVTQSVSALAESDTDFSSGEYSEFVDRPVTKSVAAGADKEKILDVNVSTIATENSELGTIVSSETDERGIPNLITYKALHGYAPPYIRELLTVYEPRRTLRSESTGKLVVPRSHKKSAGDRAFSVSAPRLWNELPQNVTECKTIDSFKKHLKTHLFNIAYKS